MKVNSQLGAMAQRLGMIAGLLVMAVVVLSAVEKKGGSRIEEVHFKVNPLPDVLSGSLITDEDLKKTLQDGFGYAMVGMPINGVDAERVELIMERDPFVGNAEVFINARNEMHITVDQRMPIVHIIDDHDQHYYLDASGKYMPTSQHFTPRVLVANGKIPPFVPEFAKSEMHPLRDVYLLSMYILQDPFLQRFVDQIYVRQNGDLILAPKVGRHNILFGKYENVQAKIERIKKFYNSAMPYVGWQEYKQLDVRYKNQIVATR